MRSTLRRVVLFLLGSLVGAIPAFGAETARPFRLDDIFELEDVGRYYGGPWAFSPDGQSLAFTRITEILRERSAASPEHAPRFRACR